MVRTDGTIDEKISGLFFVSIKSAAGPDIPHNCRCFLPTFRVRQKLVRTDIQGQGNFWKTDPLFSNWKNLARNKRRQMPPQPPRCVVRNAQVLSSRTDKKSCYPASDGVLSHFHAATVRATTLSKIHPKNDRNFLCNRTLTPPAADRPFG